MWASRLWLLMPQITVHVQCTSSPLGKPFRFQQNTNSLSGQVGPAFCYSSHFKAVKLLCKDLTDTCLIFSAASPRMKVPPEHSSNHPEHYLHTTSAHWWVPTMCFHPPSTSKSTISLQKHFSVLELHLIGVTVTSFGTSSIEITWEIWKQFPISQRYTKTILKKLSESKWFLM